MVSLLISVLDSSLLCIIVCSSHCL